MVIAVRKTLLMLFVVDVLSWCVAIIAAAFFRYDFKATDMHWPALLLACLVAVVLLTISGWGFSHYQGRYRAGTFYEIKNLVSVNALVFAGLTVFVFVMAAVGMNLPRSLPFISFPLALLLSASVRYIVRVRYEKLTLAGNPTKVSLVYGAGFLGDSIIKGIKLDANSSYFPVGMLDDDPEKRHIRVEDIPVLGTLDDLPEIAAAKEVDTLIVAIARADVDLLSKVAGKAEEAGVEVKVFPPFEEVLEGKYKLNDIRDLSIEDIIGRHPVDTRIEEIASYLRSKRVLVTGAGGSIGSELCRQIHKFGPSELMMLDRDESGLQGTQLSIYKNGLLDSKEVVLADIRDLAALNAIFEDRRPEVVFHAAALKHLPMLEQYPDEAWKTNVLGTLNVLKAARAVGVGTFVNISTDKAADPTSVLGLSKRYAEVLTSHFAAAETGSTYLSVRFGNVIGSRGSMLPTFRTQIEDGGPVTITHPDVTRYFMTIPEACQLVIQAGGIGRPGEVLILDMGEPVRILDVAQKLIQASGKDIEIVFTGLREGEKMHEDLIGAGENDERPFHPKVSHTTVPPLDEDTLDIEEFREKISHLENHHHSGSAH